MPTNATATMNKFINLAQRFQRLWLIPVLCLAAVRLAAVLFVNSATAADTNVLTPPPHGAIGLGTWNSTAEFKDIVVTAALTHSFCYRVGTVASIECYPKKATHEYSQQNGSERNCGSFASALWEGHQTGKGSDPR
jgi:hypothetical protein